MQAADPHGGGGDPSCLLSVIVHALASVHPRVLRRLIGAVVLLPVSLRPSAFPFFGQTEDLFGHLLIDWCGAQRTGVGHVN